MKIDLEAVKKELRAFYTEETDKKVEEYRVKAVKKLEETIPAGLSGFAQKGLQYQLLAEENQPHIFKSLPFAFELYEQYRRQIPEMAGSWTYKNRTGLYRELNRDLLVEKDYCLSFPIYTYIGEFGDEQYHFVCDLHPILKKGLSGICAGYEAKLSENNTPEEQEFLENTVKGLYAMKRLGERFGEEASRLAASASGEEERTHYAEIAEMSARVPWNPPLSFKEALNTILFIQSAGEMLDGVALCGGGRLDELLIDFYEKDIQSGLLTEEQAYELLSAMLLAYDLRIDHDDANQNTSLVNQTFTIGGCDENYEPLCNAVTMLTLRAYRENKLISPKLKCRYGANSPKEYLDAVNTDLRSGRTALLYVNDDTLLPAFMNSGIAKEDAWNYFILGCWEPVIPKTTNEHCAYVNLLKILELSVYEDFNRDDLKIRFRNLSEAQSTEDVYQLVLGNICAALESRCRIASQARVHWHKIDPHMLLSATFDSCLEKKRDITNGGMVYNLDELIMAGLPNVINSILVMQELCFEKKLCTMSELLAAVRNNWEDEALRKKALSCSYYGDETEKSAALTKRITDDIYAFSRTLPVAYGGRTSVGYMLFIELYRYAKAMRATPDGRRNCEYFSQGLTPSILHHVNSAAAALNTVSAVDKTKVAADSVLNISVPFNKLPLDLWESFVRTTAKCGVEALQLNCVDRETLLDARKHPESYPDLVVRVCGYSAKYTALPDYIKDEFLLRNFYEK